MQYEVLAPMYDRLMRHVTYSKWVEQITRVIKRFAVSRDPDILELGAGTGVVGSYLRGMGYKYTASDLSFCMCREARINRGLPVCVADATRLPFKKQFDMALFLYDGINYLFTQAEYRKLFAEVYDALIPGGLFLFDITTQANGLNNFSDFVDFEDYGDFSYIRRSYFDPYKSIQYNDFTIYKRVDADNNSQPLYEKYTEEHKQKVFTVPEIEKMIPKKRFSVLGIWDGYTFRKYTKKSDRIHFLLKKDF